MVEATAVEDFTAEGSMAGEFAAAITAGIAISLEVTGMVVGTATTGTGVVTTAAVITVVVITVAVGTAARVMVEDIGTATRIGGGIIRLGTTTTVTKRSSKQ